MRARNTHETPGLFFRATSTERGITVLQLLAAVSLILVLALVVPALTAGVVQQRRVARAIAEVARIATALRQLSPAGLAGPELPTATTPARSPARTLVGPGELPKTLDHPEWLSGRSDTLASRLPGDGPGRDAVVGGSSPSSRRPPDIGADPWGNCYLVNIGAEGALWVLSAGSNGIVETAYEQPSTRATVGGDDVAARVRR